MKKTILILLLIFIKKNSYCSNNIKDFKDNYNIILKETIKEINTQYKVDTFSLSIYSPLIYQNIFNIFYGKNVKNEFIDQNTQFPIASISKIITANIIEDIFKEKSIRLNEKVKKWVNISEFVNNKKVEELINHNSLIPNYANNASFWLTKNNNYSKIFTSDELISYSKNLNITSLKWQYSNTNYVLLGKIIESESEKNLKSVYSDFFKKQHMPYTFYESDKIVNNLIYGNARKNRFFELNASWLNSAGAVFSTPQETLNYSLNYLKTILKENKVWTNTENGKLSFNITDNAYLNGFFRMNTPFGIIYYTPGMIPGFTSAFIYSPCLATAISFSANRSSLPYFQGYLIGKMYKDLFKSEAYNALIKTNNPDAEFCNLVTPSTNYNFTDMD